MYLTAKQGENVMKKIMILLLLILFITHLHAEVGFKGRPIITNIGMQTGYTLNKSEFIIGIGSIGFGITDNIQLGTNILWFMLQAYNANLKISLLKTERSAFAAGISYYSFNWTIFDSETSVNSFTPFATYSVSVGEDTKLHLGAQYSFFTTENDDLEVEDAEIEQTSQGTSIFTGIEYSMSHKTKFLAEAGYDVTFEGLRIGGAVLFGWTTFRLKLGVNYFSPKGGDSFTWPIIGLWWRFKG